MRWSTGKRGLAGVSLAILSASVVQAQDNSVAIPLEPITVTGKSESPTGSVNGYVAKNTTAGSKSNTPIQEIPQSVSVIGRQELESHQPQSVDQALGYTAGVAAQPFGNDPRTDWIHIRGFDASQSGVFLDGLPLYQYAFGSFKIDPFTLERIEVLNGPSSALYGGGDPGGLVNLVSKMPTTTPYHEFSTGVDTWGHAYGAFDLSGPVDPSGVWSYRLTGKLSGGGYQVDNATGLLGVIAPAFTYRPDASTTLTFLSQFQHDDSNFMPGFLPFYGSAQPAPFGRISPHLNYGEPNIDTFRRDQDLVGYRFEHVFDDVWTFRQNVRYDYLNVYENGPYAFGYLDPTTGFGGALTPLTSDNLLDRIGFTTKALVRSVSADNQVEAKFNTGPVSHDTLFGLDYKYYDINQMQASGAATPLSATNPAYGAPQSATTPYLIQNYTMNQLGAYLQDQMRFGGGWLLTLNGRYDELWTNSTEAVGGSDFSSTQGALSGRAGLAYEFSDGITPYVAISRSFNPEIGTDVNGLPFKPDFGVQYEAGVKYKPNFFDALITASLFDLTRTNVAVADPSNPFFDEQLGAVRSRGFEMEAKANITEGLKLTAAFTAYQLRTTEDPDPTVVGKVPEGMPETLASLWADYTIQTGAFKDLGFGAGVRYQGASYADNQNLYRVPDAGLLDLAAHYHFQQWDFSLNVNNVTNKLYVASCNTVYSCGYGEGRTAVFAATYKW
jgi:iron complex outermembrane recepter protein